MSAFSLFQERFARAIMGEDKEREEGERLFAAGNPALPPSLTLAIYRNNVFASLTEALREAYPVVCRLTGEGFFRAAAKAFLCRHLPLERSLVVFGEGFAEFLQEFPPALALPYLADVARFERARLVASHAEDAAALAPQALQAQNEQDFANMRLGTLPSLQILALHWDAPLIWEAHQEAEIKEMELEEKRLEVALWRRGDEIRWIEMEEGACVFLRALADGLKIQDALHKTLSRHEDFDLQAALTLFWHHRIFTAPKER